MERGFIVRVYERKKIYCRPKMHRRHLKVVVLANKVGQLEMKVFGIFCP